MATQVEANMDLQEAARPRRRLSPGVAFAAVSGIFVLFAAAASAPTPLYVVYQKEWGFSATTLTVVFAVYAIALIGSLLTVGLFLITLVAARYLVRRSPSRL